MTAQIQSQSALARLTEERGVFARLAKRLSDLQQEEQQIRGKLRHRDELEESTGELLEVEALLASQGPLTSPRGGLIDRLHEVLALQPQVKKALIKQDELISILQREASREVVMGSEGDQWRKAVKNLAKVVKELLVAESAVAEAAKALGRVLPDPDSLKQVRFPAGPVYSFEPDDLARVCASFEARLFETDRYYTP